MEDIDTRLLDLQSTYRTNVMVSWVLGNYVMNPANAKDQSAMRMALGEFIGDASKEDLNLVARLLMQKSNGFLHRFLRRQSDLDEDVQVAAFRQYAKLRRPLRPRWTTLTFNVLNRLPPKVRLFIMWSSINESGITFSISLDELNILLFPLIKLGDDRVEDIKKCVSNRLNYPSEDKLTEMLIDYDCKDLMNNPDKLKDLVREQWKHSSLDCKKRRLL